MALPATTSPRLAASTSGHKAACPPSPRSTIAVKRLFTPRPLTEHRLIVASLEQKAMSFDDSPANRFRIGRTTCHGIWLSIQFSHQTAT